MDQALKKTLLDMLELDQKVREDLVAQGVLNDGYHPEMEEVHNQNAAKLLEIINQSGWPNKDQVGQSASDAAWIIAQHAISKPDFQRKCLEILKVQASKGLIELSKIAKLQDRICFFEGKPQIYGTQFDWDENKQLSPLPIQDIKNVDSLRETMGLPSLDETILEIRLHANNNNERPPIDLQEKKRKFQLWLKKVGWRK